MENVKTIEKEYKGSVWESALDKAFRKAKKDVKVDGFRAGAVPKEIFFIDKSLVFFIYFNIVFINSAIFGVL